MGNTRKMRKGTKKNVKRGKKDRKSKKMRGGVSSKKQYNHYIPHQKIIAKAAASAFRKKRAGNLARYSQMFPRISTNKPKYNNDHIPLTIKFIKQKYGLKFIPDGKNINYRETSIIGEESYKIAIYSYNGEQKIRFYLDRSPVELNTSTDSLKKYIKDGGYSFIKDKSTYAATLNRTTQPQPQPQPQPEDVDMDMDEDEAEAEDEDED